MNQPANANIIRTATPNDAAAIVHLMQTEPGFWQPSWSEAMIARTLAASTTIALIASSPPAPSCSPLPPGTEPGMRAAPAHEQANPIAPKLAGFACAHHLGFRGYLSELIVAPNHRGQGIASNLLAAIEQRLREADCPLLIADVWHDAEEFYRAQGWTPPDAVLLRKRLTP